MATQNALQIKEKIISILKFKGPSLPVHIAKETGLSMLFASAFLSELLSEKTIKISTMKIGSSPIYYIPGQEQRLENFAVHLKSKEKEAYLLLKERKFLTDKEQEPAIRVALRSIRDFAIPFKRDEEIFWRYFTIAEEDLKIEKELDQILTPKKSSKRKEPESDKEKVIQLQIEEDKKLIPIIETELDVFNKKTEMKKEQKPKAKKIKKIQKKQNEKLFNRVKEELARRGVEILDIEDFSKKEIILRAKINDKEHLLVAYDKKRINETDIINAYKKSSEKNLPYIILTTGEPLKKINNLIEAIKNLSKIERIKEE